ncbi:SRPBCC family protein [Sphaerisporangium fuscum]|uniref:SRPBCC family protein n=1 Tax=Sphaerisporangium fuscum TaxID=2835868 RepID=UPI001BDC2A4D|nr:SRPBCC family protein [Sphaerisporangium fuscum]
MTQQRVSGLLKALPDPLKDQLRGLAGTAGKLALQAVAKRVDNKTRQLRGYAEGSGDGPGLFSLLTGTEGRWGQVKGVAKLAFSGLKHKLGFGKSKGKKLKLINIEESLDMGAPRRVVYNQWTQFQDFPSFMKKVEKVVQESDEKLNWQAKIFWSRRQWQSTITEQVPDEKIIWRSQGAKGYVDGAVTFHEVTPDMTRVLMALEYHPKGFMEHVGSMWRAQGRRARLEFKHFRRHVMNELLLHPDEVEGWRGVIHEGEVVKDHETALREEEEEREERERRGEPEEAEYAEEEGPREAEEGPEGEEEPEEAGERASGPEEREEREEEPAHSEEEERRRRRWGFRRGERTAEEERPPVSSHRSQPGEGEERPRRRPEGGRGEEPHARRRRPEGGEGEERPRRPREEATRRSRQ